jgi:predicted MFS family arabinose efflux permease
VQNVQPRRRGAANATFFVGFDLGIGIGAIVWGLVAQAFGYQAVYLWCLLPIALGGVVYALVSRRAAE